MSHEGDPLTGRLQRLRRARLYVMVTRSLCKRGLETAAHGALEGGAGIIQLREKDLEDRELLQLARVVRGWTGKAGALFVLNDRADLAVLCEADGVHMGQEDLSVADARRIVGPDCLVGVSTHDISQARQAVRDGADYIGVGPVFPSQTKAFQQFPGLEYVRQVSSEIALPAFAIGGIEESNLSEVLAVGATRVAVSGAVCRSDDPSGATRRLKQIMRDPCGAPEE